MNVVVKQGAIKKTLTMDNGATVMSVKLLLASGVVKMRGSMQLERICLSRGDVACDDADALQPNETLLLRLQPAKRGRVVKTEPVDDPEEIDFDELETHMNNGGALRGGHDLEAARALRKKLHNRKSYLHRIGPDPHVRELEEIERRGKVLRDAMDDFIHGNHEEINVEHQRVAKLWESAFERAQRSAAAAFHGMAQIHLRAREDAYGL